MSNSNSDDRIFTKEKLINDLQNLGIVESDCLVVTASLKSIGKVDGGASTVLQSLLDVIGSDGGVLGLSFTPTYQLPLTNTDAKKVFTRSTPTYTGTFNEVLLKHPKSIRSKHPSRSFVGIGRKANQLLSAHDHTKPSYDPVYQLSKSKHGKMLLLGTKQKCPGVTTVHVAQNLLKFKNKLQGKFGVNYLTDDQQTKLHVENDVGGCSLGFWKFYDAYRRAGITNEGKVGHAETMVVSLMGSLAIDLTILRKDPSFFFCDDPYCHSCRCCWEFSERDPRYYYLCLINAVKSFPTIRKSFQIIRGMRTYLKKR